MKYTVCKHGYDDEDDVDVQDDEDLLKMLILTLMTALMMTLTHRRGDDGENIEDNNEVL